MAGHRQMAPRRVCITGIGVVSPLGLCAESNWKSLISGRKVASEIQQFDASTWPVRIACEVQDFKLDQSACFDEQRPLLNRPVEFGMQAAHEAMLMSGLAGKIEPERFGIFIGAGIGAVSPHTLIKMLQGLDDGSELNISKLIEGHRAQDERIVLRNHPGMLAACLSSRWQALGPVSTIHTACASSGQSIGQAYRQIQYGRADAVLAGGADSLAGELLLAGFCLLGALSKRNDDPQTASRPFDKDRDGFVAGEGAGMMVLEEREHALARGARILGEIVGYGETSSAYRITDLPPDGRGVVDSMQLALSEACCHPEEIGYINAHGTSTEINDRVEAEAIRKVFYSVGATPCISSSKSTTGHLISAAGAVELIFSLQALQQQIIPPNVNLFDSDCGDDLLFAGQTAQTIPFRFALSNSVGFGGSNASILIGTGDRP